MREEIPRSDPPLVRVNEDLNYYRAEMLKIKQSQRPLFINVRNYYFQQKVCLSVIFSLT